MIALTDAAVNGFGLSLDCLHAEACFVPVGHDREPICNSLRNQETLANELS